MPEVTRGMQIDDAATLAGLTDSFAGQIVNYCEVTKDGQRKILHSSAGDISIDTGLHRQAQFPNRYSPASG